MTALIGACAAFSVWKIILAPLIFGGYPIADNYEFNIPWAAYFSDQLYDGDFYPRWLTDYAYGIGAPVFYFYGPAPFYLAAFVQSACMNCELKAALALWHLSFYLLAAVGFYYWARSFCGRGLSALCAALYAALPYHLIDLELRGSLGESLAYAFTPLVLLGIKNTVANGRAPLLAGFSYAGLILSHLPTALLFTPILTAYVYIAMSTRGIWRPTVQLAGTGFIGVILAAVYILPAITLRDFLLPDGWVAPFGGDYEPSTWLFFSNAALSEGGAATRLTVTAALAISSAIAAASVALLIIVRLFQKDGDAFFRGCKARHIAAAGISLVLCWIMMTNLVSWLYVHVGPFRQVQFPWRIGTIIDLMSATIVLLAASRITQAMSKDVDHAPKFAVVSVVSVTVFATASVLVVVGGLITPKERGTRLETSLQTQLVLLGRPPLEPLTPKQLFAELPVEYRTKWIADSAVYRQGLNATSENIHVAAYKKWRAAVLAKPEAWVESGASDVSATEVIRTGPTAFAITTNLKEAAGIGLRRAYFPSWRLLDAGSGEKLELRPRESDGLMAFDAPAGETMLILRTEPLPVEIAGASISAAALIGLLLIMLARVFRRVSVRKD